MYLEVDLQIAPIEIRHFREIVLQYYLYLNIIISIRVKE